MVEGVTNGFEKRLEIQGVGYRASLRGADLELNVGYSHPVVVEGAGGDHVRGADARPRSSSRGSTSSRSGRPRPRCARCARPSRTRARASATRASTSAGRSGSEHERRSRSREARIAPPQARAQQALRHRRAAAPGRVPLQPRDRGAARRRPRGQDARRRELAAAQARSRARRATRRPRSASCSRSGRRTPGSRPPSSTAAATCTTAASRRWPMRHAKEDSKF